MKNRKPPTEIELAETLRKGTLALPPIRWRLAKIQPRYDQARPWDFEIEGTSSQSNTKLRPRPSTSSKPSTNAEMRD